MNKTGILIVIVSDADATFCFDKTTRIEDESSEDEMIDDDACCDG